MSASQVPTARLSGAGGAGGRPGTPDAPYVLRRYRLVRRLGTGAFGTVWRAHDERLGRDVAIKILPRERVVSGRFEREARAAARLIHPSIVTLYEAAVDDEGAYLVSELVLGGTMSSLLRAGRLSDHDVVAITVALCDGLRHAHAHGVVHRDVKPSNILVPERPSAPAYPAKLTDFGVARVAGGDSLTRTGDVIGTLAYMAPEQAEGRPAGPSADLYSLALVTYEALTGVNPVLHSSAAARARRLGTYLPPLRRQRRDLPRELGRAIDLALRPRARERGTLAELRGALAACQDELGDEPRVVAPPRPTITVRRPEPGAEEWHEPADPPPAVADVWQDEGEPDGQPPEDQPPFPGHERAGEEVPLFAPERPAPIPWPARGLAAAATALLVGWLPSRLLIHLPLSAASAAMVAGLLVLLIPRLGWMIISAALVTAALIDGRTGSALVLAVGSAVPIVLMPGRGATWPLAAAAPGLGLLGLLGAWPALAGRLGRTAWRRAALGAVGWLWLLLCAPLADVGLRSLLRGGSPLAATWSTSLSSAVRDVISAPVSSGAVLGALVWAAAALVLPWVLRGPLPRQLFLVACWSIPPVLLTLLLPSPGGTGNPLVRPGSALLGAVAGAILALAAPAVRTVRDRRYERGSEPRFP